MTEISRRHFNIGAATLALAGASGGASAQAAYPAQDVHVIVGFAPGSGPDVIARFVMEKMRPHLKSVVIENKPGAGGNIASEYIARAKPDGYTLYLTGGSALAASGSLFKKLPFDVIDDFEMVATLSRQPTLMVVGQNAPYKDIAGLTKGLKDKGAKASYGTAFPTARVLGKIYTDTIGAPAVEVQYRTSADWINDLNAGHIDFGIIDAASGATHAKNGRFRIVAVGTAERSAAMPEYPTLKSQGVDVDLPGWWCVYAPKGTPDAIKDKLHGWFTEVVQTDDVRKFLTGIANEPFPLTRKEASDYYVRDVKLWEKYVEIAKIEKQ